jgi:putative lumazine-binding protein
VVKDQSRRLLPTQLSGFSMKTSILTLILLSAVTRVAHSQTGADSAAIRSTALDYVEGWYEGNAQRMSRALHPELVKRIVVSDTVTGQSVLQNMGATALVNGARHGYGKSTPRERQQKDVTILDIFHHAASVKGVMAEWIDYMQLAKVNGRWVIVNVLWEMKPESRAH